MARRYYTNTSGGETAKQQPSPSGNKSGRRYYSNESPKETPVSEPQTPVSEILANPVYTPPKSTDTQSYLNQARTDWTKRANDAIMGTAGGTDVAQANKVADFLANIPIRSTDDFLNDRYNMQALSDAYQPLADAITAQRPENRPLTSTDNFLPTNMEAVSNAYQAAVDKSIADNQARAAELKAEYDAAPQKIADLQTQIDAVDNNIAEASRRLENALFPEDIDAINAELTALGEQKTALMQQKAETEAAQKENPYSPEYRSDEQKAKTEKEQEQLDEIFKQMDASPNYREKMSLRDKAVDMLMANPDLEAPAWFRLQQSVRGGINKGLGSIANGGASFLDATGIGDFIDEAVTAFTGYELNPMQAWTDDIREHNATMERYYNAATSGSAVAEGINKYLPEIVRALPALVIAGMTGGSSLYATSLGTTAEISQMSGAAQELATIGEGIKTMSASPNFMAAFVPEAGMAYENAIKDGMSETDAAVYSMLYGYFSAIEEIGGTNAMAGGMQSYVANGGGAKAFARSILSEIKEENIQGFLEAGMRSFFGEDVPIAAIPGGENGALKGLYDRGILTSDTNNMGAMINPRRSWEETKGAAIVSSVLGAPTAISSSIHSANTRQNTETQPTQTPTVEDVTENTAEDTSVVETLLDILQNRRNSETGQITQSAIAEIQNNPALLALFNETAQTSVTEQKNGVNRAAIRNNADAVIDALTQTESAPTVDTSVNEGTPAVNEESNAEETKVDTPAVEETQTAPKVNTEETEETPTVEEAEAEEFVEEESAEEEKPKSYKEKVKDKVREILQKGDQITDADMDYILNHDSAYEALRDYGIDPDRELIGSNRQRRAALRGLAADLLNNGEVPSAEVSEQLKSENRKRSAEHLYLDEIQRLDEQIEAARQQGDTARVNELTEKKDAYSKKLSATKDILNKYKQQQKAKEASKKERAAVKQTIKDIDGYIKNLANMGKNPQNGKYIPQSLIGSVKEAIQIITMERAGNIDLATEQKLADIAEQIRNAESIDDADALLKKWERTVKGDERMQAKFDKILNAVQEMRDMNKNTNDVRPDILADYVNSIAEKLGNTPFYLMNSEQLGELRNALKAITTTVNSTVNTKILGQIKTAYEAELELRNEVANARTFAEAKGNTVGDIARAGLSASELAWNRPEVVFNLLGGRHVDSAFNALYHALDQAYQDKAGMVVKGREFFDDLLKDTKGIRSLRGKVAVDGIVNSNGKKIEMSRGMRLYLRMLLENSDSARSIVLGGLSIPERVAYYLGVNDNGFGTTMQRSVGTSEELNTLRHDYRKLAEQYQELDAKTNKNLDWQTNIDDVVTKMDSIEARINQILEENGQSVEDMKAAIDADLTAYEREWLDKAREFFDWAGEQVDKANLDEYGFAKAIVENYVPILRDANFRNTSIENIVREMSIRNWGSMKARSNFATQPIMLMDLFDVCDSYLSKASTYAKMMPILNEFQRIWNTTEATDNASGNIESLRDTIRAKFGKAGVKYIDNLIQDIQGGRNATLLGLDVSGLSTALNRARGNLAKASLTLNPGVALGQTASYISAGAKIPGKYLLKALATPESKNSIMERINENTLVLKDRMSGSGSVIKADANIVDRAYNKMNWLTGWIQNMDTRTVVKLYQACEFYVEDSLGISKDSPEFNQAVTDTWIEVLETTQPEYNPLQRPDILRSPDTLVKSMTMFMTQRLQNYNTMFNAAANLEQAVHDMNVAKESGEAEAIENATAALKTRGTEFTRSMSSIIGSNAAYVAIRALADGILHRWDKWRDKETGEITGEAIAKRLAWMFGETMAGSIPLGNMAFTLLESSITGQKYYGLSVSGISNISTALEDIVNVGQAVFGGADEEKTLAKAYKAAKSIADMMGISATNAEKLVKSVMDWYGEIRNIVENDAVLGEYYEFSTKQNKNRLWNALQDDDYEKAERVMNSMGDNAEANAKAVIKDHYQAGDISTNEVADMLAGIGIEDSDKQANTWEEKEEYKKFTEDNPGTSLNETAYKSYEASDNKPDRETFDRVVGDVTSETGKAYGNVSQTELYDYLKSDDSITDEEKGKIWDTWFPDAAKSYSGMLTYEAVQEAKADATGEYDSKGDNAILHMLLDSDYDDAGKDDAMGFAGKGIRDDYSVLRNEGYPADDVIGWLLGIDAMGTGKSLNNGSISQPEMKAFYLENPDLEYVIEALWNSQKYKNGTEAGLWENNRP